MNDNNLLDRIRRLNRAFILPDKHLAALAEGVQAIAEISDSRVVVADSEGSILAGRLADGNNDESLERLSKEGSLNDDPALLKLIKSKETIFNEQFSGQAAGKAYYIAVPISSGGKNFATLLLSRKNSPFEKDHLVLAEVSAILIGMLILQAAAEKEEQATRNRELAEGAFESLSYSEVEAIREILNNISNNESVVVASKIADSLGITRSVIVNALRKFESAGIIESRSLGMKGTFIRVKNLHALEIIASRSAKMGRIS